MKNITTIAKYDITNIKNVVLNNLNKFTLSNTNLNNTDNIVRKAKAHKNTTHLTFLFEKNLNDPSYIQSYNKELYIQIEKDISAIFKILTDYYKDNFIIARCLITCLKPNSIIPAHVDSGFVLEKGHRIHIPIITDKFNSFTVGNTTKHLKENYIYEINNCIKHAAINDSNSSRYHLILDLLAKKFLN